MTDKKPLHIVKLQVENIKRVQAVTVEPDGSLVVIGGRNAQGKTSTLDAIEMALGGKKTIPTDPVRRGARKARIVADLGEIMVERTFTPKGTALVVKNKEGVPIKSPQTLLDELCSKVAFDPFVFGRLDPTKQDMIVRDLVGIDFTELDSKRAVLYESRKEANREMRSLDARAEALPDTKKTAPVDVTDLLAKLESAQNKLATNEAMREDLDEAKGSAQRAIDRVLELQIDLKEAKDASGGWETTVKEQTKLVDALVDPDVDAIKEQLANAEETNAKARTWKELGDLQSRANEKAKHAEECDDAIAAIDEEKAKAIAAAKFPVEGLGFDDTGVTLDGVPFEQASQAQKLRTSVAIGARLNPLVKVMLVRDGSSLDSENLKLLAELAAETDSQVWLERVSEDGKGCSVVIEDGLVAEEKATENG